MMSHAPIVLFVYARPWHTRKVLESLERNPEARDSVLYIFADGPKEGATTEQIEAIREVRQLITEKSWCGDVRLVESSTNRGLADSIVSGVTEVVGIHGRVIVLEDDIELGPGALAFFNAALNLYQSDDAVMQISGFMVRSPIWVPSTGFLRMSSSWGWATWDRAWKHYSSDSTALRKRIDQVGRSAFDLENSSFHYEELCRNERGELKTWAVKWYGAVFLAGGLCLYPKKSVLRNVGFDGSGENCANDSSNYFNRLPIANRIRLHRIPIEENPIYLKAMRKSFQYRLQVWTGTRLRDRLERKLKTVLSGIFKQK
jgi:GT2 family glycosyltransferase